MQSSGRVRGVVRVPRWICMCTAVALIAFKAHGAPSSAVAAETERQAGVSARGAQVMPFELSATTHVFTKTAVGALRFLRPDRNPWRAHAGTGGPQEGQTWRNQSALPRPRQRRAD